MTPKVDYCKYFNTFLVVGGDIVDEPSQTAAAAADPSVDAEA